MTLVIDLSPELEKKLQEAAERRQLPAAEYARVLVETALGDIPSGPLFRTASPEEWRRVFHAWVETHRDLPILPDEAFSRESIYGDRGL